MSDLSPLVSHDAIASLTPAKKKSLLAAVAKELGKEWKAEPVDDALGLPLLHVPTKLRFRLIPGGSFTMGLTADDVEQCEKYVGGYPDEIAELKKWARPLRQVEVAPFLCTEQPLYGPELKSLLPSYEGDELPKRKVAVEIAERHGFRLPSEVELEWLARNGTEAAFVTDLVGTGALVLSDKGLTTFNHKKAVSRFGVKGLLSALWAADDWHGSYKGAPIDSEPWMGGKAEGVVRWTNVSNVLCAGDDMVWGFLSALRDKPGEPGQVMLVAPLSRFIPALIGQKPPAPPKKKATAKKVVSKQAVAFRKLKTLKGNGGKLPSLLIGVGAGGTKTCVVDWFLSEVLGAVVGSGERCEAVPAVVEEALRLLPEAAMPEMLLMLLSHVVGNDQIRAWLAPASEATHPPVLEVLNRHRELVLAQLTSDSATVRSVGATLLMTVGEWREETIPKLMAMVEGDAEPMVRASAVLALSRLGEGRPECEEMLRLAAGDSSRGAEVQGAAAVGRLRLDATASYESVHEGLRAWFGLPLREPRFGVPQTKTFHWFGATGPFKFFPHLPLVWPLAELAQKRNDHEALLSCLLEDVATQRDPKILCEVEPFVLRLSNLDCRTGADVNKPLLPTEFAERHQLLLPGFANALVPVLPSFGLPACGSVRRRWLGLDEPGPLERLSLRNGGFIPPSSDELPAILEGLSRHERWRVMVEGSIGLYGLRFGLDNEEIEHELQRVVCDDSFRSYAIPVIEELALWCDTVRRTEKKGYFSAAEALMLLPFLRKGHPVRTEWLGMLEDTHRPHQQEILRRLPTEQLLAHCRRVKERYPNSAAYYLERVHKLVPDADVLGQCS